MTMKREKTRLKRLNRRRAVRRVKTGGIAFRKTTADLAEIARGFYARGWALGTSGNFSAVVSREPMRLAITATGLDKGTLMPEHFLEVDDSAKVLTGEGKPSAEALLHIAIVRGLAAGGVLHT